MSQPNRRRVHLFSCHGQFWGVRTGSVHTNATVYKKSANIFFTNASNNVQRRRWRRRRCFVGGDRIFVTDLIRRRAACLFDAAEPQNAPGPHRRSGRAPTRRQKGRAATNVHKDQRRPSHAVIATVETRRPEDHFERADRLGWSKWREKSRSFLAGL